MLQILQDAPRSRTIRKPLSLRVSCGMRYIDGRRGGREPARFHSAAQCLPFAELFHSRPDNNDSTIRQKKASPQGLAAGQAMDLEGVV